MSSLGSAALSSVTFDYVRQLVYDHSAIVLDDDKQYLVSTRLRPVLQKHDEKDVEQLVRRLRAGRATEIIEDVVDALTTNETLFFRDQHPFDALAQTLIPEAMERNQTTRSLFIWSAAASTGQEAYSVLMTIKERIPELANWNLRLVCTDISKTALNRAQEGRYSEHEMSRGLPPLLRNRYFERDAKHYRAVASLRAVPEFRQLNLTAPWYGLPRFDIVLLRNVLIYFDQKTREGIFTQLARFTKPGGAVLLGGAETNGPAGFERRMVGRTLVFERAESGVSKKLGQQGFRKKLGGNNANSHCR